MMFPLPLRGGGGLGSFFTHNARAKFYLPRHLHRGGLELSMHYRGSTGRKSRKRRNLKC